MTRRLCALAAVLLAVGCSSSAGSPGASGSGGGARTSVSVVSKGVAPDTGSGAASAGSSTAAPDRDAQLTAQTNGEAHTVVAVPGGDEAAVYDQQGSIEFWGVSEAAAQWTRLGTSSYPVDSALGPPAVAVTGAVLTGMQHATFILHGTFTTDSALNAIAFTTGANGWGAIKAEPNGNIGPSGRPVGADRLGLSFDFAFVDGRLETKDCPSNVPVADCAAHATTKLWAWTGHDFRLAS